MIGLGIGDTHLLQVSVDRIRGSSIWSKTVTRLIRLTLPKPHFLFGMIMHSK